ncbi:hypothetical protein LAZ67_19001005 [Cordylochernes scorpioides]|uniref:Uncharacterized protein n=1 Tax=Cordylochernes scorpioides TaxID=51811 RepID=A0ABY6LHG0_9ARAC|nr:hypothetical protein LAZ67_19001005 [Cordylochernes scorpioides]
MALKGRRFDTRESIIADSKKVLKNIPQDAFSKWFRSWERDGNYMAKDKPNLLLANSPGTADSVPERPSFEFQTGEEIYRKSIYRRLNLKNRLKKQTIQNRWQATSMHGANDCCYQRRSSLDELG